MGGLYRGAVEVCGVRLKFHGSGFPRIASSREDVIRGRYAEYGPVEFKLKRDRYTRAIRTKSRECDSHRAA